MSTREDKMQEMLINVRDFIEQNIPEFKRNKSCVDVSRAVGRKIEKYEIQIKITRDEYDFIFSKDAVEL